MKVQNCISTRGNSVANQFLIVGALIQDPRDKRKKIKGDLFQSYDSTIVFKGDGMIFLDERYWDYSVTTGKYRNQFLNENKKETQRKIESGEYILTNLN